MMRSKPRRILVRGHIDAHGGYGQITIGIIQGLIARGYLVDVWPIDCSVSVTVPLPKEVTGRFVQGTDLPAQLLIYTPDIEVGQDKIATAQITMWEASRIKLEHKRFLNRAKAVIVPNDWNATTFSAYGVNRPLYKMPLWVDGEAFPVRPLPPATPFVFGTAGRNVGAVRRKRMDRVAKAFVKAFPNRDDVRLEIKCFPGCEIQVPNDSRITVVWECMSQERLAEWFAGIHCFVSANAGGGWELMIHQAMATGRPVIAAKFGGVAEYFDGLCGWELPYSYEQAEGYYAPGGIWAGVSVEDVARVMAGAQRLISEPTGYFKAYGSIAATRARKFTLDRSMDALIPVLQRHGIIV